MFNVYSFFSLDWFYAVLLVYVSVTSIFYSNEYIDIIKK